MTSLSPLLSHCRGGVLRPPRRDPGGTPGNAPGGLYVEAFYSFVLIKSRFILCTGTLYRVFFFTYDSPVVALDGSAGDLWDVENVSREVDASERRANEGGVKEKVEKTSMAGVLNPVACFHLGDVILFTVDTRHYPLYDL